MTRVGSCLIGLALAACAVSPAPAPSGSADADASPTASDAAATAPSPTPLVETAADLLECDGPMSEMGGRADGFGPSGGGATPDEALEAFLADPIFSIPRAGYERVLTAVDRAVYTLERDGTTKIVIVVSDRFGELVGAPFTVEELRACQMAEFGPVDFGPSRRVWTHHATGRIVTDIEGPSHCEWQSARMLHVGEGAATRQYLRDPEGVFSFARLLDTYAEGVELPPDATDSGYRSPTGLELWFTESDRAAYVVTPDGVERWPRAEEPVGCM